MNRETRIRLGWLALCPWVLVVATHGWAPAATPLPSNTGRIYRGDPTPLSQSRRVCQFVANVSARARVSGRVHGKEVSRDLWIYSFSDVQVRIESAGDSTRPPFVLWAEDDLSQLYFPQSRQLVESPTPAPLIEAVFGIPLTPRDFAQLTMGCPSWDVNWVNVWQPRNGWLRVLHESDQLYLRRASERRPWSLVAIDHHLYKSPFGWRARFLEQRLDNAPRQLQITSLEWNGVEATRFDLRFAFNALELMPTSQPPDKELRSAAKAATKTTVESVKGQWPLIAVRSIRQDVSRQ